MNNASRWIMTALMGMMWVCGVYAGDLTPSSSPASTMHSLEEIYNKVDVLPSAAVVIPSDSIFGVSSGINMTVEGKEQGEIKGDCTILGREDTHIILGIEHGVKIPTDANSGLPTGQRIHQPLTVTVYRSSGSPLLFGATCSGEQCEVEISFYSKNALGTEQKYYTIKLSNAIIVAAEASFPNLEKFSFTYEKIIWTHEISGVESEDSWKTP